MDSQAVHYVFFIMALKMISQSGTWFSIFYSHLFKNHFWNFKLITLSSLLEIFPSPYPFMELKQCIHFKDLIHISVFLLSFPCI